MTTQEAHKTLGGTVSSEKNEILFGRYGINYNKLDPLFRRGSIILWEPQEDNGPIAESAGTDETKTTNQVSLQTTTDGVVANMLTQSCDSPHRNHKGRRRMSNQLLNW